MQEGRGGGGRWASRVAIAAWDWEEEARRERSDQTHSGELAPNCLPGHYLATLSPWRTTSTPAVDTFLLEPAFSSATPLDVYPVAL